MQIRTVEEQDWAAIIGLLARAFGETIDPRESELNRKVTELDRTIAAYDGAGPVGTGSIASLQLSVPGGIVPVAAVTSVGVSPTHRRRGVMTALLRKQFEDVHEAGREALACLYASEGAIYQRFGYGMGVPTATFDIDRRRSAFVRPVRPRGEMHVLDEQEALDVIRPVYDLARRDRPGLLDRPGAWWEHRLYHHHGSEGFSKWFYAAHQADELDGYVVYRLKQRWSHEGPGLVLDVEELVALNTDAYAALWRYCLDTDLVARVEGWKRPVDDPILHMLAEPRALQLTVRDGLWLRLVDVPRALESRRYAAEGRLVMEVRDADCPWNEGRVELEGDPEGASCGPTDAEPDLVADVADLGAAFLGGVAFDTLAGAGRVSGSPEAIRAADAMFTWRPAPWCAHIV